MGIVALKEGSWIHWSAVQTLVCTGGLDLLKQFGSMKVVYIAILNSLVLFQVLEGGVVPQGGEYSLISGFDGHQSSPDLILWKIPLHMNGLLHSYQYLNSLLEH